MKAIIGKKYTFSQLEKLISIDEIDDPKFYRVLNDQYQSFAMMTVFMENFSQTWQSGDGVLFYDDSEVHSADPGDIFILLEIIPIKPKLWTRKN